MKTVGFYLYQIEIENNPHAQKPLLSRFTFLIFIFKLHSINQIWKQKIKKVILKNKINEQLLYNRSFEISSCRI